MRSKRDDYANQITNLKVEIASISSEILSLESDIERIKFALSNAVSMREELNSALTENKNLALLKLLMAGYNIKSLSLINKSISKLSAVDKACVLEKSMQINTAVKNDTAIIENKNFEELLKFKSAQLMFKLGDASQKQFASAVLGQVKQVNLVVPNEAGIVEEYVASKMENLQEEVNKQIVTGKNFN